MDLRCSLDKVWCGRSALSVVLERGPPQLSSDGGFCDRSFPLYCGLGGLLAFDFSSFLCSFLLFLAALSFKADGTSYSRAKEPILYCGLGSHVKGFWCCTAVLRREDNLAFRTSKSSKLIAASTLFLGLTEMLSSGHAWTDKSK